MSPFGSIAHLNGAENFVVTGDHDGRQFIAFDYHYETTEHYTDANGHSEEGAFYTFTPDEVREILGAG